jgi:hypothetical protein
LTMATSDIFSSRPARFCVSGSWKPKGDFGYGSATPGVRRWVYRQKGWKL